VDFAGLVQPVLKKAASAAALLALAAPAFGCGYHGGVAQERSLVNLAYPQALHVHTAVWKAQLGGRLERGDPGAFRVNLLLAQLRAHLAAAPAMARPSVTLVLLGPMLWTRYQSDTGGVRVSVHVDGPEPGDVVLVTEAPVVKALLEERLSVRDALDSGLLRVYGTAEDAGAAVRWLAGPPH
jgi:hypothetical protein